MNVGLYARVSTERQQERGTVTSQLEALRAAAEAEGHAIVEECVDDGYSGAGWTVPRSNAYETPPRPERSMVSSASGRS